MKKHMKSRNKKIVISFILIISLIIIYAIFITISRTIEKNKSVDATTHGIIINDNVEFYVLGFNMRLNKGDNAYIYNEYSKKGKRYAKIKCKNRVGKILAENVYYYEKSENQKYSLMCDVSSFNKDIFHNANEFEYFLLKNKIQYVYIRMGGRGYGEKGNFYSDDYFSTYKEACEYLKIPYGYYFVDEAISYDEAQEEVNYILDFLNNNTDAKMNVLPVSIDVEYNEGTGRGDALWNVKSNYISYIQDKLGENNIKLICYCNAKRASKYLSSLNAKFWLSFYLEDGKIPAEWYTSNKDQDAANNIKLMSNQIMWQFSENGAQNDGINENVDLSLVIDSELKKMY